MYFVIQKKFIIQTLIAGLSLVLTNQALTETLEDDFTNDVPVVLSATRLAQPQSEAPVATTIIDRKMIEAMGVVEIAEIFRIVPGFQVAFSDGTIPVVTYHGMSDEYARRMQVLIDGRSVYTPTLGGPEWVDLPLAIEDIERIEVVRGPNAVTFGANSFLGVINIITRNASEEHGSTVKIIKGSKDDNHIFYRYGFKSNNIDTRISVRHQQDHGLKRDMGNALGKFIGDSKLTNLMTLRSDIQLDKNDVLELHLGMSDGNREKGTNDSVTNVFHKKYIKTNYQMVRWRHLYDARNEMHFQFFHNYNDVDDVWLTDDLASFGLPGKRALLDESKTGQRFDLEYQKIITPNNITRFVVGGSARKDIVKSKAFFDSTNSIANYIYRGFINNETRIGQFLFNSGFMLEDDSITGFHVSPRLAINFHINKNHTVRASASRAYRSPVILEEYSNWQATTTDNSATDLLLISSGGLRPESIVSKEIGYLFNSPGNNFSFDVKIYKDEIQDIIDFTTITGAGDLDDKYDDVINLNWAEVEGFEFQSKYMPNKRSTLTTGYAYANIKSSDLLLDTNNLLSLSIPKHSFSILASHEFPNNISASLAYYNVGQMTWLGSGGLIPKYNRTDFRLSRNFRRGEIKAEFVLQNVFNKKYYDFENESVNERRLFANLTIHF